jgi:5'-nucleotidase
MHVLVSNDDGVDAPGIRHLSEALRAAGHRVTVMAPDRDRSGASNSLTLDQPIRASRRDEHTWSVAGTPTDCVHLALAGMLEADPDIVFSGINNSSNLGDDVIYSGTVAAAMEGRCLGLPAVAVSLACAEKPRHFESAARAAVELLARLLSDPLPADTILNVNVPDRPWHEIQGFEVTRLGKRHRSAPCIAQTDPRGKPIWWIGPSGGAEDDGPGTDFDAVRRGYVSVTPIHVDLTRYQALEKISGWMQAMTEAMDEKAA